MSKRAAPPIVTLYQHGIDVTAYPRDPDLWPPFRSPLFEVTEGPGGVRTTECIAIPVPHYPALRRALAFGLSTVERAAIHEFLGTERRQLEREAEIEAEAESRANGGGRRVIQPSLF